MRLEDRFDDPQCQAVWKWITRNHPSKTYFNSSYDEEAGIFRTYAVDLGQVVGVEVAKVKVKKVAAKKKASAPSAKKTVATPSPTPKARSTKKKPAAKKSSAKAAVRKAAAERRRKG